MESPRLSAPNKDRKRVIEADGRTNCNVELRFVFTFHLFINCPRIGNRRMMKNRRVGGTSVFGIEVNLSRNEGVVSKFVADKGLRNARILDLPSGDLAAFAFARVGSGDSYSVQRISRAGVIAAGWPADGVGLTGVVATFSEQSQSFVADDDGYLWHTFRANATNAEFVAPNGTLSPTAYPYYFNFGSTTGFCNRAAPIPGGDMFITRGSDRITRVTRTGAYAFGWTSAGLSLPGWAYDDLAMLPDGGGGVVVFMRANGYGNPIATRIDGNKVVHAGWPAAGLVLSSNFDPLNFNLDSALLPSGPDHFIAAWWSGQAESGQIHLQRFGLDGALDPAWPTDGVPVAAPDTIAALTFLADGLGGAYVLRQKDHTPVATHVSVTGAIVAGPDVSVLDTAAQYSPTFVQSHLYHDKIMADVTLGGGLLVGWGDTRLAPTVSFRVRWLLANLTADPGKPDSGVVVFPASTGTSAGSMLDVHSDGVVGAFVSWAARTTGTNQGELWMTHVSAPTPLAVELPGPRASRLALSTPRPNPAHDAITFDLKLPDDSEARVELLDVAGRVLRTQQARGAGEHRLEFRDLRSIAPGLYFLRAITGAESSTARVVFSR